MIKTKAEHLNNWAITDWVALDREWNVYFFGPTHSFVECVAIALGDHFPLIMRANSYLYYIKKGKN